jgi:uncharacterized protein YcgI (DUF1989 family)
MKPTMPPPGPDDAAARRAIRPVICYPVDNLPPADLGRLSRAGAKLTKIDEITVPPREARCFHVPDHHFFRISSIEGPQVGDLNLWAADNLDEKFYAGKTRALHGTHLSVGDRLWSCFPYLRPLATITKDSLDWYGWDADGGSVHDVIGTRCDPYTARLLSDVDYHHCCHSNLTRALARFKKVDLATAESYIHDVLNVFMCTGFTHDTHQYFMKASPVRPGDYLEFFAETALIGGLSACPGGDCGAEHSSDLVECHPLLIEVFAGDTAMLHGYQPITPSPYSRSHGTS